MKKKDYNALSLRAKDALAKLGMDTPSKVKPVKESDVKPLRNVGVLCIAILKKQGL